MVYKKLGMYLEEYDPTLVTGSGFTKAKLKPLIELNIVQYAKLPGKTGKLPATPNAFVLTDFGRSVVRSALNQSVSTADAFAKTNKTLSEVRKELQDNKDKISSIENTLQNLEKSMLKALSNQGQTSSSGQQSTQINEKEIIALLKNAQYKASSNQKLGNLYSVDLYFRSIQNRTGSTQDQINSLLYKLYQQNILDLQLGPGKKGEFAVKTPSGKQFHWGQMLR